MAKTTIEIDVNTGDSAKSLADLRNEFKDIQKELSGLTPGTEKYVDALKKLGAVKDEIGDLKDQIQGFAGADKKISAVTNVVGGLASGFQAAQGAAAIFGTESENLEKTLLRIQAVMAFTQGIQGIAQLGDSLSVLGNVIKSTELGAKAAAVAQRIWNLAIAANPIALIIAGLTALIGVIAVFVSSSEDETEAMKESIKQRERELELMNKTADALKSENKFRLDLAAAQGKSAAELAKLNEELSRNEIKNIDKRIKENKRLFDQRLVLMKNTSDEEFIDLQKANSETLAEMQRLANERLDIQRSLKIQEAKLETEANKASSEKAKERVKEIKDDSGQRQLEENQRLYDEWLESQRISDELHDQARAKEQERQKQLQDDYELTAKQNDEFNYKLYLEQKKRDEDLILNKQKAKEQEVALTLQGLQSIQSLADAFAGKSEASQKKAFQIKKAASLAQATIETYQAAQSAFASQMAIPTPDAPIRANIAAAIAIASGLARVAVIAKTKFEGGGGGGATGGGAGNLGTFTQGGGGGQPPQGLTAQNTVTQLNPDGTVAGQGQRQAAPMKAYVVESESRAVTERVNKLSNNSKIG